MKKVFYLLFFVLAFYACKSDTKQKTETKQTPIAGVYKTNYPCADCSGIEVALTVNEDGTFVYTQIYKGKVDGRFKESGKYKIENNLLTFKQNGKPVHFSIGENTLTFLGEDLKPQTGQFASYYVLKKQQKFNYIGNYETFHEDEESYRGTLSISPKGKEYEVIFSASKVKNRENCRFSGVGTLKNDTIWVNISNETDKKVWMYIAPSHDNLGVEVFTKNFEERFKMMYYCGGGGSLAGKYVKTGITSNSISVFDTSSTIKDVLQTVPADQTRKKVGHGEFKDDLYDDYEIYGSNQECLFIITPKDTANVNQKINTVMVHSPFFKTAKGINIKSTYGDIKNAYTINGFQPTREHIVFTVDEINASFSISKTKLKKGWWNEKTKSVNEDKIPLNAQVDDFVLWWGEKIVMHPPQ